MSPRPPAEISYRFYAALDAIELALKDVARRKPELKGDCNDLCNEMEEVADDVLQCAATRGWSAAYPIFTPFQRRYEDFILRVY